jgi:anthraniloyl-CoA monooxygenase
MSDRGLTRVAVVGAGPGGLFLASLLRRNLPDVLVTVFERNQRSDAFGFGVVFSDATLRAVDEADPVLRDALKTHGCHWDRIDIWSQGERFSFSGNGMAAIHRKVLLRELQEGAETAGVDLRFGVEAPPLDVLEAEFDVVVGADGTNSAVRQELDARGTLGHRVDGASAKFIWFGVEHLFPGLTFLHRVSEHGNFAVHGYPISDELSTFIVETDEDAWRAAGLDRFDVAQAPGPSDKASQAYLEKLFAEDTNAAPLVANNSRWGNFRTRRTERWFRDRVVLLGDAVHTAHFSVGSGTKMAMEDAVVLASELTWVARGDKGLDDAFVDYQRVRAESVAKIHGAAGPSLSWWEHFGFYQQHLDPLTFAFHFFSRSIGVERIARRDPALAEQVRSVWRSEHGTDALRSSVELRGMHDGEVRIKRSLRVSNTDERGLVSLADEDGNSVTVPLVHAPSDEGDVYAAAAKLPPTGTVVLTGDQALARVRLAEEARLARGLTVVIADLELDDEAAETLILSGRADAVAR